MCVGVCAVMAFEGLFDEKEVKIRDPKNVGYLGLKHNRPHSLTTHEHTLKYLKCVWSFIKFIRDNRDLKLLKKLTFDAGTFSSNCYWWSVLYYTNVLAAMTLKPREPSVIELQETLFMVHRMKEVQWEDHSDSKDFDSEVESEMKKLAVNYTRLRFTLFYVVAGKRHDEGDFDKASKFYVAASQLDENKDKQTWGRALLNKSLACHNFARLGEAIVWAQQYEAYMKGAVHPELQAWLKEFGKEELPKIDTKELPSSDAYKTGAAAFPDPILFVKS